MLGAELLMPLAQCQRLRRLHKTAGAVGEFIHIHRVELPQPAPSAPAARPEHPLGMKQFRQRSPNRGRRYDVGSVGKSGKMLQHGFWDMGWVVTAMIDRRRIAPRFHECADRERLDTGRAATLLLAKNQLMGV